MNVAHADEISGQALLFGMLAFLFALLPLLGVLNGVVVCLIFIALITRLCAYRYGWPLFGQHWRVLLVCVGLGLMVLLHHQKWSQEIWIDFLLLFVGFKGFELYTRRDLQGLALINFFMIFTTLLLTLQVWVFGYMLVAVFLNLVFLMQIGADRGGLWGGVKCVVFVFLLALPCALILFLIFPRLPEPLWRVPGLSAASVGFSDELKLGGFSNLAMSHELALRIEYLEGAPQSLYWQGVILSAFDGWVWRRKTLTGFRPLPYLSNLNQATVNVYQEAHQGHWLFYQHRPISGAPHLAYASDEGLRRAARHPGGRQSYALTLAVPFKETLSVTLKNQNTRLPKNFNPRLAAWAKMHHQAFKDNPAAFVHFLRQYIYNHDYWYRLQSAPLPINSEQLDRFWFERREGYCETYASAVAFILRSVGIPARIVIGYYGGQWNPMQKTLTFFQSDAHAWVEYWHDLRGWVQFDPTMAIAPKRVEKSLSERFAGLTTPLDVYSIYHALPLYMRLGLLLEQWHYDLERWLLFYNYNTQQQLLRYFNAPDASTLFFFFMGGGGIALLGGAMLWWRQQNTQCKINRYWQRLKEALSARGIALKEPVTFHVLVQSLMDAFPEHAERIRQLMRDYERLRYGNREVKKSDAGEVLAILKTLHSLGDKNKSRVHTLKNRNFGHLRKR